MRNPSRQQLKRQAQLAERGHEMRLLPTPSEAPLWSELKGNRPGVSLRRQGLIGNRYIADVLAPRVKFVVEINGGYHARRVVADARRDRVLKRLGYRMLRLDAEIVLTRLAEAAERESEAVGQPGSR